MSSETVKIYSNVATLKSFNSFVFAGGTSDFLKLDLSFINMRFYKLKSPEFVEALSQLNDNESQRLHNLQYFNDLEKNLPSHVDSLFVILPSSLTNEYKENNVALLQVCLLIMFPSDFHVIGNALFVLNINSRKFKRGWGQTLKYRVNDMRKHDPKYLAFGKSDATSVNRFLKNYIEHEGNYKYLNVAIQSYYNSFFQDELRLCYTTLFICLESITAADSEITFQMSRYCAVINSKTKDEGNLIFKNTKKLYSIRSKIVHGNDVDSDLIKSHYFRLQMLASRTLVELISHAITNKEYLADKVNVLGFGEKQKLSDHYTDYQILPDQIELLLQELPNKARK